MGNGRYSTFDEKDNDDTTLQWIERGVGVKIWREHRHFGMGIDGFFCTKYGRKSLIRPRCVLITVLWRRLVTPRYSLSLFWLICEEGCHAKF